jgi:predicted DNA-binding transcriptional regulator AlpA
MRNASPLAIKAAAELPERRRATDEATPGAPLTRGPNAPRGPPLDLVFPADICKAFGICRETLWRWTQRGIIAPPRRFGSRVAWTAGYIAEWIAGRPSGLPEQPEALKPYSVKGQPKRTKKAASEAGTAV